MTRTDYPNCLKLEDYNRTAFNRNLPFLIDFC